MKINPITMLNNNVCKVNFKAQNNEDEYVYVPLIWDNESYDSVEFSDSAVRNQNGANSNGVQGTTPQGGKSSRFKKIATGAAGTVGTVTLIPAGIEKVAKTVENTVTTTKDSINNTVDSIAEIKEHTRAVFHKDKPAQDLADRHEAAGNHDTESLLAGETPVQNHDDFDRIHHNHDDDPDIIDDINDFDDAHHDDIETTYYEG